MLSRHMSGARPVKITRISRIKRQKVIRDFTWPDDLDPFGRFNLIYGWNGCGKTTLSALFRHLQTGSSIESGTVDFEVDDKHVSGAALDTAVLPPVRVFNRAFITDTILSVGDEMDPIFYLGESSVETQSRVESLKHGLKDTLANASQAAASEAEAEQALNASCVARAKFIKDALRSSHPSGYETYDKRRFRTAIGQLSKERAAAESLEEEERLSLTQKKDAQPKELIPRLDLILPDLTGLERDAKELVERSVVSAMIDALAADAEVGKWVQTGLTLHSGERESSSCHFCGGEFSTARRLELEGHFSDEVTTLQRECDDLLGRLAAEHDRISNFHLPEPSAVYEHLVPDFKQLGAKAQGLLAKTLEALTSLRALVARKRDAPFDSVSMGVLEMPALPEFETVLSSLGVIVDEHNGITDGFRAEVKAACVALEKGHLAEAYEQFVQLKAAADRASALAQQLTKEIGETQREIATLEREIVEHRRPAEELNAELRSYLGRDELRFEVRETGYAMTRGGHPAGDLSEGEKTAIAFLYFLKTLQDRAFDLPEGVVVIDDPVSSLDANALFSAFGYMKERTKNAGQLFILTHNFSFFQQVKNWFQHLKGQNKKKTLDRPARFYHMRAWFDGANRTAGLFRLDPLLERYSSEYHYLFKQIFLASRRDPGEGKLEECYGLPNQARRLLETFMSFRYPALEGRLAKQLDEVAFDAAKKTRILRFLHTYSHTIGVGEPGHDPYGLAEAGQILSELLELIAASDPPHFESMLELIGEQDKEPEAA